MNTWILILLIFSGNGRSAITTQVFHSKEACQATGEYWKKKYYANIFTDAQYSCTEEKVTK